LIGEKSTAHKTSRPVEGILAETFEAAVTAAVSQILAAREISASGNTRFAIYPALAQTDVLDYKIDLFFTCYLKSSTSHHCGVQVRFTRVINELKANYLGIFLSALSNLRAFLVE
jgi:hypothetical protein